MRTFLDKSIIVLPEQGFGDAILMSRFLPGLKADGAARVAMVVKKPLVRLLSRVEGVDEITPAARRSDHFDFYTPNMSLPHFGWYARGRRPAAACPA